MTFLGYSDSPRGELHQPTWVMTQMGDINSVRTESSQPVWYDLHGSTQLEGRADQRLSAGCLGENEGFVSR
jgi:hypothetical protein